MFEQGKYSETDNTQIILKHFGSLTHILVVSMLEYSFYYTTLPNDTYTDFVPYSKIFKTIFFTNYNEILMER